MGKRSGGGSDKTKSRRRSGCPESRGDEFRLVDVARVRFQHSRIRPTFSGCGRSVAGTLESIRRGELSPHDLPPIQVLAFDDEPSSAGSADEEQQGPWYFSLNNRRLWVLKRCREEGLLLPSNLVRVRARKPKSAAEVSRYTVQNCALEATLMRETVASDKATTCVEREREKDRRTAQTMPPAEKFVAEARLMGDGAQPSDPSSSDGDSSSDDDDGSLAGRFSNRFSAIVD